MRNITKFRLDIPIKTLEYLFVRFKCLYNGVFLLQSFGTIEEKAREWGISVRYIQVLCKQGLIEGAIKRANAWFIPDTAENPTKRTKSDNGSLPMHGTKKEIFTKAVDLFAARAYESVTVKDVADEAGVGHSSVYNYFKSKREILDAVYDYYCHYFPPSRPTLDELEPVIRHGTLLDIVNCVNHEYAEGPDKLFIPIAQIIFRRAFIDERAREISSSLIIDSGIKFAHGFFDRAVQLGRLAPFDTYSMALFINSNRIYVFYKWLIMPSDRHFTTLSEELKTINKYVIQDLTDLGPSNIKN